MWGRAKNWAITISVSPLGVSPVGRCVKSDKSLTNICEEVIVVVLRVFLCPTDS